jgi:very-short-patch-repair endonuclease
MQSQASKMTEKKHRVYPPLLARARELRQPQTPAESRLWLRLRDRQLGGLKFRRQHPIGRLIADFYCAASQQVIEIDGDSHSEQTEYDLARTEWLSERGYRVIRFPNLDVYHRLDAVLEAIWEECQKLPLTPNPSPSEGEGSTAPCGEGEGTDSLSPLGRGAG